MYIDAVFNWETYQPQVKSKSQGRSDRKVQQAAEIWRFLKSAMCFLRSKKKEYNEKIKGRTETRRIRSRRTDREALT